MTLNAWPSDRDFKHTFANLLPCQPRTPRCPAAVRVSTVWPRRATAARWEATAAPCLEGEVEEEEDGGTASSPTETQS